MNTWISVKDKLPDDGDEVLIVMVGFDKPSFAEKIDLGWFDYRLDRIIPEAKITHWMPLPEMPK
jgi:hypothetical protein